MIGEVLANRYEIQQQLAKKTGRRTLLARDLNTYELVVIKLLSFNSEFEWNDFKLFEREAKTLKNLSHTSIPNYVDYFEIKKPLQGFVLVQSYIPSQTLEEYIKSGRTFTEAEVKQIGTKVLDILIYLHSLSPPVIHRDIKPSNILLGNRTGNYVGDIHLIDFGSVQASGLSNDSSTRTVVGTYGYMSLEQFGDRAVPASDIYSLGATLIFLVTGIHPADLPQKDGCIKFENFTSLSDGFIRWLKAITEPTLEIRIQSAREAVFALKQLEVKKNNFSDTCSQIIRGDWYWDGKNWISKSKQLLQNNFPGKFNSNKLKLSKPQGSKIKLRKNESDLEILIPPMGFHPSLIFLTLFSVALNSLTLLWTVVAINSGAFPANILFASLSLPFWASGFFFIYGLIFSLFGKTRLCVDKEQISKFYELLWFKFQRPVASRKKDIHRLTYIPRHFIKDSEGKKTKVFAQLIISTQTRKYKFQDGGAIASESELEWLASELSDWLNLPVSSD